jgi:hypothetical protein
MTLDPQISTQFDQSIGIRAASSIDQHGQVTYATSATTVAARVIYSQDTVRTPSGAEVATTHKVITATAIAYTTKIWLPGDSTSTASLGRLPQRIETGISEFGGSSDFYVVWL